MSLLRTNMIGTAKPTFLPSYSKAVGEYVKKQPSLEEVFLALVGDTGETDTPDDDRTDGTVPAEKKLR